MELAYLAWTTGSSRLTNISISLEGQQHGNTKESGQTQFNQASSYQRWSGECHKRTKGSCHSMVLSEKASMGQQRNRHMVSQQEGSFLLSH